MVVVPAGSFMMGSTQSEIGYLVRRFDGTRFENEGPRHKVTIAKPFAVGRTHVTRGEFAAFVKATGYETKGGCYTGVNSEGKINVDASWRNPGFEQTDDHPVLCVNWNDANAYVNWLNEKVAEKPYRLLSESEAEYMTRAVTKPGSYPRFYFGNDEGDLCKYGNGLDQTFKASGKDPTNWPYLACRDGYVFTAPVGSFKPNAWGVYDVMGNASTWTQDCATNYKDAPRNGSAQTSVDCRWHQLRGGSWNQGPQNLRAANRDLTETENRNDFIGFRVARTISPSR
ncbi:MAG: formylglycine-generating enzyme family protein [Rhodomicrobium sp.]